MADSSTAPEDKSVTFHVKSAGGAKYTVTLPLSTSASDLKNKLSSEEYANVPAASQRLIYSGKVLKDTDTLATHNVKDGNTMHLVKSAPSNQRQNPANQSSPTSTQPSTTPQATVPQTFAAGTGNDPLAGLTGARYAGFAQLPSASMFQNPPNPEDMIRQLQDPNFAQMMRETLNNPQMIDMMINSNPQLRAMGPQARQMLQSEQFRRMMTDPEALRSMIQMQRMMGMDPTDSFGGRGGQGAFPAPGVTTTTDPQNAQTNQPSQDQNQPNPFAAYGGMGMNPFMNLFNPPAPQTATTNTQTGSAITNTTADTNRGTDTSTNPTSNPTSPPVQQQQQANPFAALFNPALFGAPPNQQQNPSDPTSNNPPAYNPFMANPLLNNPEAMNQLMRALGGGAGGPGLPGPNTEGGPNQAPPFNIMDLLAGGAGGGGFGGPADNRPPEERFAVQLRQLNEMGFFDYDRNIQALSRSGGDVNGALEWLFSQPQ